MLKPILDSPVKERILFTVLTRKETYARDLVALFGGHLLSVQNQLKKLENGGVLVSQLRGRTRLYSFNPRYPFLDELKALLQKALSFLGKEERKEYYQPRLRPRRAGKPL
ncbi:MAG: winged helix-turn-helix domain-containing protein [bacterium]